VCCRCSFVDLYDPAGHPLQPVVSLRTHLRNQTSSQIALRLDSKTSLAILPAARRADGLLEPSLGILMKHRPQWETRDSRLSHAWLPQGQGRYPTANSAVVAEGCHSHQVVWMACAWMMLRLSVSD
jgi:hypothetical protein